MQGNVLPCQKCAFNFNNHLVDHPLSDDVFASRTNLLEWVRQLKNEVNHDLGKPPISQKEFIDYANNLLHTNSLSVNQLQNSLFGNGASQYIVLAIIIILLIVMYQKK